MEPQHIAAKYLLAKMFHPQEGELLSFQKRNDRGCAPFADRVEISGEIAIPSSAHSVWVIFPRAESDPNPSEVGSSSYDCNLQRVGQGCSFHHKRSCF